MATQEQYSGFSVEDFIKDEAFQLWVYSPDDESSAFWNTFLAEHPEQAANVEEARKFLSLLDFNDDDVFETRISALKKRIDLSIDYPEFSKPTSDLKRTRRYIGLTGRRWVKVAAVITLLVLAFVAERRINRPMYAHYLFMTEQSTAKGQRTMLTFDDGTKVWLNVDSKLRYPESFNTGTTREVHLDGEAFFEVAEDPSKPFIVHAGALRIKVLGTSFNVRSYEKDDEIQTALVKGKVAIESTDENANTLTLAPNQMASYDKSTKRILLNNQADTEVMAGWKDGRLIFDDEPLSEIVTALERWYDVKITVEDKKSLKCHFSAKVENLTLTEVLELFKASDGIDYTIDGKEVVIKGLICEP